VPIAAVEFDRCPPVEVSGFVPSMTVDAPQGARYATRRGEVGVRAADPSDDEDGGTQDGAQTLELRVLGCRSGMPGPDAPSSGYLVQTGAATLLFDCGPGVAGELRGALEHRTLDGVFVSHLHLDHCYDLLPVAKTLLSPHVSYPRDGQQGLLIGTIVPVPCHMPPDGTEAFRTVQGLFPVRSSPPLDQAFDLVFEAVETTPGGRYDMGDCTVTAVALRHAVPVCGFRVSSDAGSLAYTADSGWTEALIDLAMGVDVLLCEATLREPDTGSHGHLSATEAGRLATLADVGALVLTHFSSSDEEHLAALHADAAARFDGPILLAAPRTTITFHPTDRTPQE